MTAARSVRWVGIRLHSRVYVCTLAQAERVYIFYLALEQAEEEKRPKKLV